MSRRMLFTTSSVELFYEYGVLGIIVVVSFSIIAYLYHTMENSNKQNIEDLRHRLDVQEEVFATAVNTFQVTTQQYCKQGEVLDDIKNQMVQVAHQMEKVSWELDSVNKKVDVLQTEIRKDR